MTAEIAVLNRSAVALAADSASTSLQATGLPKIFNTADKLFHLDGFSPIGIMVYGNSSFMGVPWETIIKKYRSVGSTPSGKLAEAADKFLTFLSSPELFSDAYLSQWLELQIRELAGEAARLVIPEKQRLRSATPPSPVTSVCADLLARVASWPLLSGLAQAEIDAFLGRWQTNMEAAISDAFAADPLDASEQDMLKQIIARVNLTVPQPTDGALSGVVLAGFGEEELFPVLWNCQVRSVLTSRVLQRTAQELEPLQLQMGVPAMIRPFAQAEMVHSFMNGIDPTLRLTIQNGVSNLVQRFADHLAHISGLVGPPLAAFKANASATSASLNQGFSDEIARYCREKHVDPVLAAIGLLPKDELAVMAETLVSLTSFKRKMSRDAETVGGDIDVAVISKGDGYIWVKRKHYFPPELNLRYLKRIEKGAI
jgi:hypothetical protein